MTSSLTSAPKRLLDPIPPRILSRADCEAYFHRIAGFATGGGETSVTLRSTWTANLRWARNRPSTGGDTIEQVAEMTRQRDGLTIGGEIDKLDDASLKLAMQTLEQRLAAGEANQNALDLLPAQQYVTPPIWSDTTFHLTAQQISDTARRSVDPIVDAKLTAAGYVEAGAASWAIFNTCGLEAYSATTGTLYTETVRNAEGTASGWAGKRHLDWTKLETTAVSETALKKCVASANPVAIEPGRYTAILEPDVTCVMLSFAVEAMDRAAAETGKTVYTLAQGVSKIGHQVLDSRLTISTDPMDPECGYMPFAPDGSPYRPVTWVENGVLKALPYDRAYAKKQLGSDSALPNPMAFRVSGGDASIEAMIASTERGILVTHFGLMSLDDLQRLTLSAVTRDGLFLIEHGKITHAIKNLLMNESPFEAFNKVVQLGRSVITTGTHTFSWGGALRDVPARALTDGRVPVVAPPIKVEDFNFTRLSDAV